MTCGAPFPETATVCVHGPPPPGPTSSGLWSRVPGRLRSTQHRTRFQSTPATPEKGRFFVTREGSRFPGREQLIHGSPVLRKQREPRSSKPSRRNLPDKRQAWRRKRPEEGPLGLAEMFGWSKGDREVTRGR